MRFPTTVLVLALSLSLCSGMLMRVNAGEPASVSRSDSLPPVKATQATSPAISVPAAMGFCCANGKVTASKAADCAARNGRFFTSAVAAQQACQKYGQPMPVHPTGKVNPLTKKPVGSTPKPVPGKIQPMAPGLPGGVTSQPPAANGPDLRTTGWQWSASPRVGAPIGTGAILTFTITNQGTQSAPANRIAIGVESAPDGAPAAELAAVFECPPLAPGKSMSFAWPSASGDTWQKGIYRFSFAIDKDNAIAESNELNNQRIFTVEPKALAVVNPAIQVQGGVSQVGLPDLAIVSAPDWPQKIVLADLGEKVTFRAKVTNTGIVASSPTTVRLSRVNPQNNATASMGQVPLPSLAVGASVVVQIEGALPPTKRAVGTHHLRMVIDPMMDLLEVTRDNNFTDVIPVEYILKSDLTLFKPGEARVFPDRMVAVDKPVKMVFTVYNMTRESSSGPITLTLTCQGQPAGVESYTALGGGHDGSTDGCDGQGHGCHVFSFTRTWSTPGVRQCEVSVRHQGGAEYEVDPANNHADFRVNVHPDWASPN